jgi:hypothetical protein
MESAIWREMERSLEQGRLKRKTRVVPQLPLPLTRPPAGSLLLRGGASAAQNTAGSSSDDDGDDDNGSSSGDGGGSLALLARLGGVRSAWWEEQAMRWAGLKSREEKQESEARKGAKSWWKRISGGAEAADPSAVVRQQDGALVLRADHDAAASGPSSLRAPGDGAGGDGGTGAQAAAGEDGQASRAGSPTPTRSEVARAFWQTGLTGEGFAEWAATERGLAVEAAQNEVNVLCWGEGPFGLVLRRCVAETPRYRERVVLRRTYDPTSPHGPKPVPYASTAAWLRMVGLQAEDVAALRALGHRVCGGEDEDEEHEPPEVKKQMVTPPRSPHTSPHRCLVPR